MRRFSPLLAVIPARGGSKGIPRKNLRHFCGQPLITWSIKTALESQRYLPRVVVTSDDAEILQVARDAGADTILRPESLATDDARTDDVLIHALDHLAAAQGYKPTMITLLQPTSPVRPPGMFDAFMSTWLNDATKDCMISAHRLHFVWQHTSDSRYAFESNAPSRPMRQALTEPELRWAENGSLYACNVSALREHRSRVHGRVGVFETPREASIDIDDEADFEMAEALQRRVSRRGITVPFPVRRT